MILKRRCLALILMAALCTGLVPAASAAGIEMNMQYTMISGGMSHTLAVKADGTVWAWGSNESLQLGVGAEITESKKPVVVEGITAAEVAAGYNFSAALRYDGTVDVWGEGHPLQHAPFERISTISAGQTDLLALSYDGTVWQWTPFSDREPVQVPNLSEIVAISAGGGHYLAMKASGEVWAWGRNDHGQLGDGTTTDRADPVQVQGLLNAVDISAGQSHSIASTFDGTVFAWGSNSFGELGNKKTDDSSTPVEAKSLSDAVQVAAGNQSSMALTEKGKIYTWGYGEYGQLGNGKSSISQSTPAALELSGQAPVYIAAGVYHNMLVTTKGEVFTWGRNKNGQLGVSRDSTGLTPSNAFRLGDLSASGIARYQVNLFQGLHTWSEAEIRALYDTHLVPPLLWCDYDSNITRAEFAHMLVNVYLQVKNADLHVTTKADFKDLDKHPLREDVLLAYRLGFINGRSDTVIAPDDTITRQEAAKMLCSFVAKMEGLSIPTKTVSLSYYRDASAIGEWAAPYVAFAYDNDIMKGSGDAFNPLGDFTREQSLLTMARLVEKYAWAD